MELGPELARVRSGQRVFQTSCCLETTCLRCLESFLFRVPRDGVTCRVLRVLQRYISVGFSGQQISLNVSGLLPGWVDAVWTSFRAALRPQGSAGRSLCLSTSAPLPLEAVADEERNDVTKPDITWGTLMAGTTNKKRRQRDQTRLDAEAEN